MRTSRTLGVISVALLALMLVLSACGADDDAGSNGNGTTSTTSVGGTSSPADTTPATDQPDATDPPDNRGLAIDPCDLVTNEEAADAVGSATEEPDLSPFIGEEFSQCLWRIEGGSDIDPALVVQVRPDTSADEYQEQVEENCPEEIGGANPINGIGDAAAECIALLVLSGDVMFAVTVISNSTDPDRDYAKQEELAQKIIDRL